MIKFNVILNNSKWLNNLRNPTIYIERKINKLNKKRNIFRNKIVYCSLLLSGDKEIKKLNEKFRGKKKTTDVLSFPFYEKIELKSQLKINKEIYLGDIIVNYNKIKNRNFKIEFDKLWIHGLTHLLGHDHKKDKDFYNMRNIEKKFLSYIK